MKRYLDRDMGDYFSLNASGGKDRRSHLDGISVGTYFPKWETKRLKLKFLSLIKGLFISPQLTTKNTKTKSDFSNVISFDQQIRNVTINGLPPEVMLLSLQVTKPRLHDMSVVR